MSKKDNFNQAMFDMFGVGKDPSKAQNSPVPAQPETPAVSPVAASSGSVAEDLDLLDENILQFKPEDDEPKLKVLSIPVTYLAPGTRVEGTLRAEGSVEIDGEFKGDILAEGSVTVRTDVTGNITAKSLNVFGCCLTGDAHITEQVVMNENSSINGNVSAENLNCSGTIIGDLDIKRNMTLDQSAKLVGNVTTGTMTIARGAVIRGTVETRGED